MATEFKHLKFGLVPSALDMGVVENSETVAKSFLDAFNGFGLMQDNNSHVEVFQVMRRYIGKDFRNWLIVNFRHGAGARKELVRKIVGYVEGRISGRSVIGQLNIDFNRIQHISANGEPITTSIIYDEYDESRNKYRVEDVDFNSIDDRHLYDFMALIGPEMAAKFILSMDGIFYDR
ncbi:putative virion structural protein [Pseudomonas phage OBP]|uniref:virion structural protein n=1 Tax=Pseudomonas phage OBP TaxID=1124849 RepID=UPI000240D49A|nr:virion structural protein [Pseudomonas phage OBP]AEV89545.1 putative virion structural protein [Pseudomonas phage OBP]